MTVTQERPPAPVSPVHVDAELDVTQTRWVWLFKWLLAIPHYVVLFFLWVAFTVVSVVAFFAILFTARYPRSLFEFNVGVLRWTWRVTYYAYGALGTDRYPPFSLGDVPDYPAHLSVDYPEHLSRGLVLVKWWLLAIPHYLVLGFLVGGGWYAVQRTTEDDVTWTSNGGLIGLLVFFAGVALLFTGRYPRPLFDLVLGLNRWVLRVAAYVALMTDVYPPFRLDQGGHEPGSAYHPVVTVPPGPAPGAPPPAPGPPGAPAPSGGPGRWGAGRVVTLVVGAVLVVGALGLGLAGGAVGVANLGLRDDAGYLMSGRQTLSTDTYALTSATMRMHAEGPGISVVRNVLGDVKFTARAANGRDPVFLGIARTDDVQRYLGGVQRAVVRDLTGSGVGGPDYRTLPGGRPSAPPANQGFWTDSSSGTGTRSVVWTPSNGDWTLVVMRPDGGRGIAVDVTAGATVPHLGWVAVGLLGLAALVLVVGAALVLLAVVYRPRPRATLPPPPAPPGPAQA